jgi:probable F420-dependent oxidoreductase
MILGRVGRATGSTASRQCKTGRSLGFRGALGDPTARLPLLPLATAAAATERLRLGTGVALAFTRSPLETAMSALDLDLISGGRVVLGLGPSVQFVNEHWHGVPYDKPLKRLREAVTLIRLILDRGYTGELGKWEGTYYKVDLSGLNVIAKPVHPHIPVYLPALFSSAVRLAADLADGLAGHPIWSLRWIREQVITTLGARLEQSHKARREFDLNLFTFVAINPDRRQGIADARGTVAFYASISQYEKYFAAHGFGEPARRAASAAQQHDYSAMLSAIPDDMVETFAVVGTPDEVQSKLIEVWKLADSVTVIAPTNFLTPDPGPEVPTSNRNHALSIAITTIICSTSSPRSFATRTSAWRLLRRYKSGASPSLPEQTLRPSSNSQGLVGTLCA